MRELHEVTAGSETAKASQSIPYHPDRVWQAFADFGTIADWHPLIAASTLEGSTPAPRPGAVRLLNTTSQDDIREELVTCDAARRRLTYRFLSSPFPVSGYLATVDVLPDTDRPDSSIVTWQATFLPDTPAQGPELATMFTKEVFTTGLAALTDHLNATS
ncbi:SRPBCC family protein [Streptomyces sp. NPDC127072]|uniref:SRPBCC family protein n=1 Tax=Streptomyces sp. NPDC127072 TaxID=3347129 RepID=UPI0036474385